MIRKKLASFFFQRKVVGSYKTVGVFASQKTPKKVPQIKEIKKDWNEFSDGYSKIDMGPQTFYYSFLTLMNWQNAKNVLEVACGTGRLLPVAVMLKNQSTKYLGVDISDNMIEKAKSNLQQNLSKYDSKLTLDQWCQKHNLKLKVANAQEKITENDEKYDRIICNLVLMLTQNPQKMLKSLYDQAEKGCLLGVTVWGDKDKNAFLDSTRKSIIELGFDLPNARSPFFLSKKIGKIAQQIGWQTVLQWQQNIIFPMIEFDFENYKEFFTFFLKKLPQNQQQMVTKKLKEKLSQFFQKKQGLNFNCQLYLFRK